MQNCRRKWRPPGCGRDSRSFNVCLLHYVLTIHPLGLTDSCHRLFWPPLLFCKNYCQILSGRSGGHCLPVLLRANREKIAWLLPFDDVLMTSSSEQCCINEGGITEWRARWLKRKRINVAARLKKIVANVAANVLLDNRCRLSPGRASGDQRVTGLCA